MAQREQQYCQNCERHTMHEFDPDPCPHLVHAIVTLFLCGMWAPVWIIHALQTGVREWHCIACGQIPGERTPKQLAFIAQKRREGFVPDAER